MAQTTALSIQTRLDNYVQALYGLSGLFASSQQVDRAEYNQYLHSVNADLALPGITAFAHIVRVPLARSASFIEETRRDTSLEKNGYPNFTIFPEGSRDEYYVTHYIYPEKPFASVLGYDLKTDIARFPTLEQARDTGQPTASQLLALLPDHAKGFIITLPLYSPGPTPKTINERRERIIGFINGVIRADELFHDIDQRQDVTFATEIQIFDASFSTEPSQENLLFLSRSDVPSSTIFDTQPDYASKQRIALGNRAWTILFHQHAPLLSLWEMLLPWILVSFSLTLSLFLFFSFRYTSLSRERAMLLAEEITKNLRMSEERYRTIIENIPDVLWTVREDGALVFVSKNIQKLLGYSAEELLKKPDLYAKLIHTEDLPIFRSAIEKLLKLHQPVLVTLRVKTKAKSWIWLECHADSSHEIDGVRVVNGVLADVSLRIKSQQALEERTRELEQINKLTMEREMKMVELKQELMALKTSCNSPST